MKVLIINGQNHRGSTYHTGRILAEKIAPKKNIDEVFLPRDFGDFCCGCGQCFTVSEKKCPHAEKLKPITDKIDSSDVIIFTVPTYVFHSTGQMKALLDHYGWRWTVHRPDERMFRKQAVVISTSAGMGHRSAIKDVADSCFFWGIPKIYKMGIAVYALKWSEVSEKTKSIIEEKTTETAKKIRSSMYSVRVPLKTKLFFELMRKLHMKAFPFDRKYWSEKGWFGNKRPWR